MSYPWAINFSRRGNRALRQWWNKPTMVQYKKKSLPQKNRAWLKKISKARELKFYDKDETSAGDTITTAGEVNVLNAFAEGDASDEREGLRITPKYIYIKGQITANASGDQTQHIRLMLVRDWQSNATTITLTDLLEDVTVIGFQKRLGTGRGRFSILWDKLYKVQKSDNTTTPRFFKIFKKLKGKMKYIGGGGTAASLGNGSLSLIAISTEVTNGPNLKFFSRLRFID